ncbi:MAG: class D sortase [Acidobacteriota bacterium]
MKTIERILWTAGLLLLAVALFGWARGAYLSRRDVARFEQARAAEKARLAALPTPTPTPPPPPVTADELAAADAKVDTELWSPKRVNEYEDSIHVDTGLPLALLSIPKIGLVVPVYEGTSDLILNRGLGRIVGTAQLGESGNCGIAGHRDGFFRGLKDIGPGDQIQLQTISGDDTYVVEDITIVLPEQVEVLRQGDEDIVTLVTCYPFYFVGSAPQRYIVRAVRIPRD